MVGVAWFIKSLKAFQMKRLLFYNHANHYALGHHLVLASTNGLQPAYARQNTSPASSLARFKHTQRLF